jgi:hypothetical protein
MKSFLAILPIGASLVACASELQRYPLKDPVWYDDDQRPVSVDCVPDPEEPGKSLCRPEDYISPFAWDVADKTVFRPIVKFFAMDFGGEAANVNALDEVPNSSWFQNRIGVRPMTPEDVRVGSCGDKPIDPTTATPGAWLIDLGKPNGANPGFRVNIEGVGKFMLKVDAAGEGEKATGATAIASRIYHAAGWWSVCDSVVYVPRNVFKLKEGLKFANNSGEERPFTTDALNTMLDGAEKRGDLVRMVASKWLPGRTIGPFRYEDTRDDDPNDVIPHEDRRDLRGARLIAAWLGHFDSREQNTMTVWLSANEKEKDSSPGHTRHYYLDFGDCFGSHWEWESLNRRINHSFYFDPGHVGADLFTLGIIERPWDVQKSKPGLEWFDYYRADFEPEAWKGGYPNPAFARMTERDGAWAARIISRFSDEHLRAAVTVGRYSDPVKSDYLVKTIAARRDAIRKRYFSKLSPISDVRVNGRQICATDLARQSDTWTREAFRYAAVQKHGADLAQNTRRSVTLRAYGELCVEVGDVGGGGSDDNPSRYTVVEVRNGVAPGPLRLHLYDLGAERGLKLVGIERPEE